MIGKTLSHYRITEQLGKGGMGEVYLADDTTLDRKVALKFLPEAFTSDPERMARFEREAKLLASLNHPNIGGIHGLEEADGNRFLVLEYVEGETLQARLRKGALPLDDALAICGQITEGLEAAHERGVIHRDLKPANVMITAEEKVKILDFGLAKALADETQSVDSSQSPTITDAMTRPGMIFGTAAYMSPEQAKGKSVDKRADIWAFGCILYESLTGKRAFEGETVTETLAAILRGEPDWDALPVTAPPNIRFALRRCLEKEVKRRFRDVGDVQIQIEERAPLPTASETIRSGFSGRFFVIAIILSLALGWGLTYMWHLSTDVYVTTTQPIKTHIKAPDGVISAFHHGFALSPDGQTLVFSARTTEDGRLQLWKRQLDQTRAQPIDGTDGGRHPFWSPDGRQIAFFVPGELRCMPADGGQVQTICTLIGPHYYGTWSENNEILFCAMLGYGSSIFRVSANGGTPLPIEEFGNKIVFCPQWLPGGRHFLLSRLDDYHSGSIYVASTDGSLSSKFVAKLENNVEPGFFLSGSGYLFFNRAGALYVQQFDLKSLSVTGQAVAISGLVGTPGGWFALAAARDEVVMLSRESMDDSGNPGDPISRLTWLNRQGEIVGRLGSPERYWSLRLSPDGLRTAVNPDADIWILDGSNRSTRVTSRPDVEYSAVWSPDGEKIAFRQGFLAPLIKPASQGGQETQLFDDSSRLFLPSDWSRDGRYLLLESTATQVSPSSDIWIYDFNEKSAKPWLETEFNENQARFSPDGNWVAYSSDVNGPIEVYLSSFKDVGRPVHVSSGGGKHPTWRSDGREIFYLGPVNELMAVNIANLNGMPKIDEPRNLFRVAMNDIAGEIFSPYDVSPDGQRFLVNMLEPPEPLLLIQGLKELLQRGQ